MPMYEYKCPDCGAKRDIFKGIVNIDRREECIHCEDGVMERQISPVAVIGDFAPYECPVTGKTIEGRRAHEENLKRTGCRILEPGERQASARERTASEEKMLESVGDTVEREIHQMPSDKRDRLCAELEGGLDVTVSRITPGNS